MPSLTAALELLERSVSYTRSSLQLITRDVIHAPTPCREWDLAALLEHMDDSLRALQDAADTGRVVMAAQEPDDPDSPVSSLKRRACALLGAWTANDGADLVSVAGCPLTAQVLVMTGAVEITVHGWDVARACGSELPDAFRAGRRAAAGGAVLLSPTATEGDASVPSRDGAALGQSRRPTCRGARASAVALDQLRGGLTPESSRRRTPTRQRDPTAARKAGSCGRPGGAGSALDISR